MCAVYNVLASERWDGEESVFEPQRVSGSEPHWSLLSDDTAERRRE